jgi:hypothetical protein
MKIDFEGFNKPGVNATQKTAATEQPVAAEQPTTTAADPGAVTSTVDVEPSAAEQLEKAQHPYKKDQPAELLTPRGIAIQTDQVRRTIEETVGAKNAQLKAVAAEVLSEKTQGKNEDIRSAVAETINAVMSKFLPAFERLGAERPAEVAARAKEAAAQERNAREWEREKYQLDQTKLAKREAQKRCNHMDSNGHHKWHISHNQPSRQPIAWCATCALVVEGKNYKCLPSKYDTPEKAEQYIRVLVAEGEIQPGSTPFFDKTGGYILCAEHPLFHIIRSIEAQAALGIV